MKSNSPLIETFNDPLFEFLQVSLVYSTFKVSEGIGFGSQTSPEPSLSKSFWSALAILGQLSTSLSIPSLSLSFDKTVNFNSVDSTWPDPLLVPFTTKSYNLG